MALPKQYWYLASAKWTAITAWAATTAYAAGVLRRQNTTPTVGNERVFAQLVPSTGVSGASEPAWGATGSTKGQKYTDGTCTWIEVTGQAAVNGDATNAPGWLAFKNQSVALGQTIYDATSGSVQVASTAGTAGNGATPTFSATAGTTTTDNTVTWTSLGLISGFTAWGAAAARAANLSGTGWVQANGAIADRIYASSTNHAETQTINFGVFWGNYLNNNASLIEIISVSDATAPPTTLAAGASITIANFNLNLGWSGFAYTNGFSFIMANFGNCYFSTTNGNNDQFMQFENCTLNMQNASSNSNANLADSEWRNCTFVFANASHFLQGNTYTLLDNCSFFQTGTVPTNPFNLGNQSGKLIVRNSDISKVTGTLVSGGQGTQGGPGYAIFNNCKLGAAVAIGGSYSHPQDAFISLHNCDSANTNYRYYFSSWWGNAQSETNVVRTGGASNGTTALSWNISSSPIVSVFSPFVSEEIATWNNFSSGSHTATIYLTSNTALDNSMFWAELEYAGTTGFPQGNLVSSKVTLLASPTALTTDSSTWGGSITNKYKIVLNFTPTGVGPVKVRLYCAKPSITVYVDPLVTLA